MTKGDTITAYLSKPETLPYKAWDDKNHPRENRLHCSLQVTNGPPEARIYVDTAGGQKDITDKETKVMVGHRIHLTAHVASTGLGEEILSAWHIPGRLFSNWLACRDAAYVELTEAFEDSSIHFAWSEGSYGGMRHKVRYVVDYAGKSLTGETTFLVFSPGTDVQVQPGTFVSYTENRDCDVLPGPHGVVIESRAMMPSNELDNGTFTIQYVQLVKSNSWGIRSVTPQVYFWVQDVHYWLLDNTYPYKKGQGQGRLSLRMQDTPGGSLGVYDAVYMDQEFEAYLMFQPPAHPELDAVPLFVPLYKVDWAWKGAACAIDLNWKTGEAPCFENNRHQWICKKPPAQYPHAAVPWQIHPEWTGVTPKNDQMRRWNEGGRPGSPSAPLPQAAQWSCD